ncbi:MAG: GNAT family N-acetyltransferase, partial [Planctomycetota bacterium]
MPDEDQYTLREMRIGNRREAELLADMWNRSDAGWPGGWTGGVPITADRVLSEEMQWDCYGQWVVERSGEIVGLVSMMADPSQPQRGYVGMLNARPDHHGRGVGKRLVRRCVDCATEAGLAELDLYTWAGNLKAVPLYKKMGFFWAPETNVEMQNFIPAIVRVPLLTDFFKRHDWYEVQERDLAVAEDVDHW